MNKAPLIAEAQIHHFILAKLYGYMYIGTVNHSQTQTLAIMKGAKQLF
jgi:hypothetical protein